MYCYPVSPHWRRIGREAAQINRNCTHECKTQSDTNANTLALHMAKDMPAGSGTFTQWRQPVRIYRYGLMLAYPLIQLQHDTKGPSKTVGELNQLDADLASQVRHWADFALGAYGSKPPDVRQDAGDLSKVAKRLEILLGAKNGVVVKMACLPAAGVEMPGHFVAVDGQRRAVVLGVRGTVDLSDTNTDAVGNSVPFPEYPGVETHQAILAAARVVLQKTRECLIEALAANPGFWRRGHWSQSGRRD
ncbi:unnamed protein product [Polarella glacialis]|uniref:Uncharacterized protein n=1 Tax=Polarella glacialis TaxID=89957 RepID=A0A813FXD6_POLGL|nr:unnamed protein product [Polarella glacialis]